MRAEDPPSPRLSALVALAAVLIFALSLALGERGTAEASGVTARVDANGSCLRLRDAPSLAAERLTCLPDGSFVTVLDDEPVEADGHRWRRVDAGLEQGWVAEQFLDFSDPAEDDPGPSADGLAPITYYYCEQGENELAWGDGGGFCGNLRSGKPVYEGAAACSAENFGQRFRIAGDPFDLVYTCEDTGSQVDGDHRDIWFHNSDDGFDWLARVGHRAEVIVVGEDGEPLARPGTFAPEPAAGGLTLALFDGSLQQLVERGEELALVSCFATADGSFVGHTFGAPAFLNDTFAAHFEASTGARPLICRRH